MLLWPLPNKPVNDPSPLAAMPASPRVEPHSQTTASLLPQRLHVSLTTSSLLSVCLILSPMSGRCSEQSSANSLKELSPLGSANSLWSFSFGAISQDYSRQNLEGTVDSVISCRMYCPLYFPHTLPLIYIFSSISTAKAFAQTITPSLLDYHKANHLVSQSPVPSRGIYS